MGGFSDLLLLKIDAWRLRKEGSGSGSGVVIKAKEPLISFYTCLSKIRVRRWLFYLLFASQFIKVDAFDEYRTAFGQPFDLWVEYSDDKWGSDQDIFVGRIVSDTVIDVLRISHAGFASHLVL
jgi:hypothetical protein